jgi:hypothetical protein
MQRASVPEAAIDVDRDAPLREDDVGPRAHVALDLHVDPEAHAPSMEEPTHGKLR